MKKTTQMAFSVSGFMNFEPEIKVNPKTQKEYMNIALGQGKNDDGSFKPSLNVVAYGQTARLIAAECKKGDLIVITKMGMINQKANVLKSDQTSFEMNYIVPVILEYQKIDYKNKTNTSTNENEAYESYANQQMNSEKDPFKDDIPF